MIWLSRFLIGSIQPQALHMFDWGEFQKNHCLDPTGALPRKMISSQMQSMLNVATYEPVSQKYVDYGVAEMKFLNWWERKEN